jgi:hypothetical protein
VQHGSLYKGIDCRPSVWADVNTYARRSWAKFAFDFCSQSELSGSNKEILEIKE